jgi:hypothetical protein
MMKLNLHDRFARQMLATIRAELGQRAVRAEQEASAGNEYLGEAWVGEDIPLSTRCVHV